MEDGTFIVNPEWADAVGPTPFHKTLYWLARYNTGEVFCPRCGERMKYMGWDGGRATLVCHGDNHTTTVRISMPQIEIQTTDPEESPKPARLTRPLLEMARRRHVEGRALMLGDVLYLWPDISRKEAAEWLAWVMETMPDCWEPGRLKAKNLEHYWPGVLAPQLLQGENQCKSRQIERSNT